MAIGFLGLASRGVRALGRRRKRAQTGKEVAQKVVGKEKGAPKTVDKSQNPPISFSSPAAVQLELPLDSKVTTKTDTEEGIALQIQSATLAIKNFLKGSLVVDKNREKDRKKVIKKGKRSALVDKLMAGAGEGQLSLPIPGAGKVKSIWESIIDFFVTTLWGMVAVRLVPLIGKIGDWLPTIGKAVALVINLGIGIVDVLSSAIKLGYDAYDWTRGVVKTVFGEDAAKGFDTFMGHIKTVVQLAIGIGMAAAALALKLGGANIIAWAKNILGIGTKATATAATATTATTATAATGTAGTVGGVSAGVAAGAVAAAGALAVGLGEGIFHLVNKGYNIEEDWKQKAAEKWWTDPRKYWWGISAGIMTVVNRLFSVVGGILDVVGAPFRMIGELIIFPFLSEDGKKKQRDNLKKYDSRIREQFRKALNAIDIFGIVSDDKGGWGSLYGPTATDKMGYTKDGKTKSRQEAAEAGKILLSTPDLISTQDLLKGKKSGEQVHKIVSIAKDKDLEAEKGDGSKTKKPEGMWRGITGFADYMTGGMWDFDQRNREGSPKDWGMRRMAGGLTDWATMGLTDFDKRGSGNLQFDPLGGGHDKAWGKETAQSLNPSVIQVDTSDSGEAKNLLFAISKDSSYEGIVDAIEKYAPYETMDEEVKVPSPVISKIMDEAIESRKVDLLPVFVDSSKDSHEVLYKGS